MNGSLTLLTDLYQLTMAYGYWRAGKETEEAVFHLFFRENPFDGGFSIAAGLESVLHYLDALRFTADDLEYLGSIHAGDGNPLFPSDFIDYLRAFRFTCHVDAIPEGTVVFPHEPLIRVTGPIAQAQIVESALLNLVNFQTLIATKAARLVLAAKGDPIIDFGLRRAQGIDGALSATRAAFIGGVSSTSNVLAGARFGIPVKGTHAHSWVMSFPSELEAFDTYARLMPNNTLLLVDTYNTLQGVANAIEVGRRLRKNGHELLGIRLDSGDLAYLSIQARRMLDEAGFPNAAIAASNELDEQVITSLKDQGAAINMWGVGTRLITAYDQPALGGVYKLAAIRNGGGAWQYKVKLSEQSIKVSTPGVLNVRRFEEDGQAVGDMIWDEAGEVPSDIMVDPLDLTRRKKFTSQMQRTDLLVPIYRNGERVYESPSLESIRARAAEQMTKFHGGVKRFVNPHRYPVGLEQQLFDLKTKLVLEQRGVPA
ncbi:MAG TPA: nicotinate phosphoribosyltransferase [Thermoanaerobaculia bacterium]|nr:nicotinate phosphoribosyltransferase [Thermoanaerobaculia bacterium]